MSNKKFTIKNLNIEELQKLLAISMSVTKSETLNFRIMPDKIVGISNNEADSIYKRWQIPMSLLCDSIETSEPLPASLKCSIFKGPEFSKKILSFFGQYVDIVFTHDGQQIKGIDLFKLNEKGKTVLKINMVTASAETAYVDYSEELIQQIFTPTEDTKIIGFDLDSSDLSSVSKLSQLSTNPETQTAWVTLYTDEEGQLKATDGVFDVVLREDGAELGDSIDISKQLWSMIDRDIYKVEVHNVQDNKIFLCKSTTRDVVISLVLLSKTDDSVNFDDFLNDDSAWN